MSLGNPRIQVLPAITDTTNYYVGLQTSYQGQDTNAIYASPKLTFQPSSTTLGLTGNFNVAGFLFPNNSSEKSLAPTITNSQLSIDLSAAAIFDVLLNTNISIINILNTQLTGRASSFALIFTGDGTVRTVVWPGGFRWASGTAPTITSTAGKRDVFVFFTIDGGASWQAFITGQNL